MGYTHLTENRFLSKSVKSVITSYCLQSRCHFYPKFLLQKHGFVWDAGLNLLGQGKVV